MKIPAKFLENYDLEDTIKCVMYLIFFYHNGMINNESFLGQLKSLRKGTLLKRKNTYHSKINDEWYSDTSILEIFRDIWEDYRSKGKTPRNNSIDFNKFIQYFGFFLPGKNKNYVIDYIYFNMLSNIPNLYKHYYERYNNYLKEFDIPNFNSKSIHDNFGLGDGYCCEDCDGDYEQYKQIRYESYIVNDNVKLLEKYFKDICNQNKTNKSVYQTPSKII
jgi:hypothetical protein